MEFEVAHSSSQRLFDTIGNTPPPSCQSILTTPAGPPPPAGVVVCAGRTVFPPLRHDFPKESSLPALTALRDAHSGFAWAFCMDAIPAVLFHGAKRLPIWGSSLGRRPPPSMSPAGSAAPLLLSGRQSRPATPAGPPSPAGVAFCAAHIARRATALTCVARHETGPEFCRNLRLTCMWRIGAVL